MPRSGGRARSRPRPGRPPSSGRDCSRSSTATTPSRSSLFDEGLACARTAGSTRIEINALSLVEVFTELGPEERISLGEEAIAGARAYGDRWLLGLVTGNHGVVLSQLGEIQEGTDLTKEAYRLCRATGDVFLTALWINNLAEAALRTEDTGDARTKLAESLELARLIGDTRGIDIATLNLGWVELLEGDFDRAGACFEEAAAIARRLGRRAYGADAICGFAQLAAAAAMPTVRRALREPRLRSAALTDSTRPRRSRSLGT